MNTRFAVLVLALFLFPPAIHNAASDPTPAVTALATPLNFAGGGSHNLTPDSDILRGATADITVVHSTNSEAWQPIPKDVLDLGWGNHDLWIRQHIANAGERPRTLFIELSTPLINQLEAFESKGGQPPQALNLAAYRHQNPVVRIKLDPGESQYLYWHVVHTGDIRIQVIAWPTESFFQHQANQQLVYGITFGISALITVISLFLFFAYQDKAYFFLALYAFTSLLFVFQTDGFLYLFVPLAGSYKPHLLPGFMSLFVLSFGLFTRAYLKLRYWSIPANRVLWFMNSLASLSLMIAAFLPHELLIQQVALLSCFLFLAVVTFIGLYVFKQGLSNGSFMAIASALVALGISSLLSTGLNLPLNSLAISNTANALSFSHFVLFLGSLLYFYRNQKQQMAATRALVTQSEENLKKAESNFNQRMQQALASSAADTAHIEQQTKTRFLTAISHDIRTPMSGILGMTSLLSDTQLDQEQRQYVSSIQSSSQNLLAVLNEFLDFSQMEAGKLELDAAPFNLQTVLDDCTALFALRNNENQQQLFPYFQPETPLHLKGDADKLGLIVLNLLDSLSEIDKNGKISLRVSSTGRNSINSAEICFEFTLSETALSEPEQLRLTHNLGLIEDTEGDHSAGSVGMTLSLELVERMHGHIKVQFAPQEAIVLFTARFILARPNEIAPPVQLAMGRGKLVIIDEHTEQRDHLRSLLTSWGADVTACADILNAEEQDAFANCDALLISDSQVNRALPPIAHTAAIVVLRYSNSITDSRGHAGTVRYLDMPILSSQLLATLNRLHETGCHDQDSNPSTPKALRVLVAEDNKVNRMVLVGMLGKLGATITEVENGAQAVEACQKGDFDIVLMDCEMPEMDGYQATLHIREDETKHHRRAKPIIALSAHTDADHKKQAELAGMNDYLSKPIDLEELNRLLGRHFSD